MKKKQPIDYKFSKNRNFINEFGIGLYNKVKEAQNFDIIRKQGLKKETIEQEIDDDIEESEDYPSSKFEIDWDELDELTTNFKKNENLPVIQEEEEEIDFGELDEFVTNFLKSENKS